MTGKLDILVLGSSGTVGVGVTRAQAWPAKLEKLLAARGVDAVVRNFATAGLPMSAFVERLLYLTDRFSPDLCLVQTATPYREYIGINGQGAVREADLDPWRVFGWARPDSPDRGPATTRLMLSPNISNPESPFYPLMLKFHVPKVRAMATEEDAQDYLTFLRFWDRCIVESDLTFIKHAKEMVALQAVFDRLSLPCAMFDWRDANVVHDQRGGRLRELLDPQNFVNGGVETCFEFLARVEPERFEALQSDPYGHLTEEGHRVVAERFLLPHVLWMIEWRLKNQRDAKHSAPAPGA